LGSSLFGDLLVLDCASFIAGPAAATILADYGARVIKIEPPGIGDSYRQIINLPNMPLSDRDYFWELDSRNKESLALDLKQESAQAVLRTLIARADVFVTNFPGPIRERLKLRSEDVLGQNEKIIYASLTPYGEEGPEKDRTGYDTTAWWARSGLMHFVRSGPTAEPNFSIPGMGDHPTAVALFGAIVAGLYRRERTGKGGVVSTSLLANGLWSASCFLQARLHNAEFRQRPPRYQRNPLTELYRCRDDRWFILAAVNQQREWPLLAECLEHPEWLSDPRFASIEKRLENSGDLTRAIEAAVLTRDWEDWHKRFIKHGLTVGVVGAPDDHLEDTQIAANGMFPEYADGNGLRTVDNPVRVSDAERKPPRMAPAIGADTRAILEELGLSRGEIATMIEAGAAGTA